MPNLFVIVGSNGAVKTTQACRFLPGEMLPHEFENADLSAAELSAFALDTAACERAAPG